MGVGTGTNKSLVQCNVGDKYPVFLCALLPGKTESCGLDLEFQEAEDVVFSVIGPRSVYLTGYYLASRPQVVGDDESESYGEDIGNSENDKSDHASEDDDYEDSFIDDGDLKDRSISIDSEGDEITVVSKPKKNKRQLKKKFQPDVAVGVDVSQQNKPVNRRYRAIVVDSDDDDLLPLSSLGKEVAKESNAKPAEGEGHNFAASDVKETIVNSNQQTTKGGDLKRAPDETGSKEGPKTKKRKKEKKAEVEQDGPVENDEKIVNEAKICNDTQLQTGNDVNQPEMTNKKSKKKKRKVQQENNDAIARPSLEDNGNAYPEGIKGSVRNPSASQIRTLLSGLIIEELEHGNADGTFACQGKKVKINFTGKLKNGSVFESNSTKSPLKFRLGAGKFIQAWDIGIEGMRVGGKRRLTVPPALGYGSQGKGENVPPDSWLVYEIELVSAR